MRLGDVWHRMQTIYDGCATLYAYREVGRNAARYVDYAMKSVVRECAIIQLANFIDIRNSLIVDFKQSGKPEFDQCLKPLFEPVLTYETAIKEMRNKFFAHVDSPAEFTIESILAKYNYPTGFDDTLFLVGCAFSYCIEVNENFYSEFQRAREQRKIMSPSSLPSEIISVDAGNENMMRVRLEAAKNLRARGFKTRVDSD